MNTMQLVRERKERFPWLYCTRCLWMTGGGQCPRHGGPEWTQERADEALRRSHAAKPAVVTSHRVRHAAHYAYGDPRRGHDLEVFDVVTPDLDAARSVLAHIGGLKYIGGSVVEGVQSWTFTRTAPMSDGTCERCAPSADVNLGNWGIG